MNYINLEEDLRIGYTIYSNDTIGLDHVTGSNNLYTTGNVTGMIDLEDLADELIDEVSLLDYCKLSEDNIEDVETTLFYEEEWEDYTKGLNNTQVLEGLREEDIILEDLTEVLSDLTVFELYQGRDVIMDMIEEGIINQFLKDKEVVQGVWRGYSQGDYLEYYAIIEFTTDTYTQFKIDTDCTVYADVGGLKQNNDDYYISNIPNGIDEIGRAHV